ncbi:(deoxy)nucleoside triphosphate pyrophosphohydrolase [Fretibacter rubidus]|uniref:(deoxy)nucleoside triphosphate pyrophosphohydrolase n=1 Tax=Fretibacter rubidus TaxID=570162 RepID=UPI00352B0C97
MSLNKPLLLVAACALIDADGRVLMSQRPSGKDHAGMWEFPGGKLETGEAPEDAVVRELYEELGIEPCLRCLQPFGFSSFAYDDFNLLMPLYLCRQWDGFLRPTEGQKVKWVFPDRLTELNLVPADVELARELRDRLPSGRRFTD